MRECFWSGILIAAICGCAERAPVDNGHGSTTSATEGTSAGASTAAPSTVERPVTGDEVRREVGQAAETTQEYLAQKSAEYREALARQIDDLDQRLKEMASESSRIAPEARTEWNARLARVQKDLQRAKDELADHSKKAWNDFQRDADAAWSDVKAGFDEAAEYLREKASPPSDDAAQHTTTPAETPRGDD